MKLNEYPKEVQEEVRSWLAVYDNVYVRTYEDERGKEFDVSSHTWITAGGKAPTKIDEFHRNEVLTADEIKEANKMLSEMNWDLW